MEAPAASSDCCLADCTSFAERSVLGKEDQTQFGVGTFFYGNFHCRFTVFKPRKRFSLFSILTMTHTYRIFIFYLLCLFLLFPCGLILFNYSVDPNHRYHFSV